MSKRFIVELFEDDYGELVLPIPNEICEELGWTEGTKLNYTLNGDEFTLAKLED